MSRNYVADDGYTEKFYVAPVPGLHGSVRGTCRPLGRLARAHHVDRSLKMSNKELVESTAELVAPLIVNWNEVDSKGQPVPPSKESLLGCKAYDAMADVLMGYAPSDLDPEWSEEEQREYRAQLKEANASRAARERIDEGN